MKKWNLHHFLLTIGYISDEKGGFNLSSYVIRSSFYLSYLIIITLCVSQKYSVKFSISLILHVKFHFFNLKIFDLIFPDELDTQNELPIRA